MTYDDPLNRFGLPANASRLEEIRHEFENALNKTTRNEGDPDLLRCLSMQLFSIGMVEDSLRLWRMKTTNFDLMCGMDVQFLCGAGIDSTRRFLDATPNEDAKAALQYLDECIAGGDFDDWTPQGWVNYYQEYFGVGSPQ